MNNLHHHSKKEFQVERLVFFSDAVFAIAITLLVIEIKVPEIKGAISETSFLDAFLLLMPRIGGFILSFFIIGLYWFSHYRMFGFVINYDNKLVWLNLLFLFSIVLLPFSTSVYSEYSSQEYIGLIFPYALYVINICMAGIFNYLIWNYIGNPKHKLAEGFPSKTFLRLAKIRTLVIPAVFLLSLLFAIIINPIVARFILFLIPVFMWIVSVKNKK